MKKNYSEILKDPRWQKKRLEVLQSKGFKCEDCGDTKKTLHVHHRYYVSNRMPWNYPPVCYQVLCKSCHDSTNEITVKNQESSEKLQCDHACWDDWEVGLNYFGTDKIYEMSFDASVASQPPEVQEFMKVGMG